MVPERARDARVVLDSLAIITVTSATHDAAARLEPAELRSLDAVHLAVALELGDSLGGLVTYDHRLAEAAALYGIEVVAPRWSARGAARGPGFFPVPAGGGPGPVR